MTLFCFLLSTLFESESILDESKNTSATEETGKSTAILFSNWNTLNDSPVSIGSRLSSIFSISSITFFASTLISVFVFEFKEILFSFSFTITLEDSNESFNNFCVISSTVILANLTLSESISVTRISEDAL